MNTEIFGIKISTLTRKQILDGIKQRISDNKKTFIVTPYSEFVYRSFWNYEFKDLLNTADFALPDGISILWLAYYFSIPLSAKKYYLKFIEALWQAVCTGLLIPMRSKRLHKIIPDKISGSEFFWDLVDLAYNNNYSVLLLGGFGDTSETTVKKVLKKFPALRIYHCNFEGNDPRSIEFINQKCPDILMVAYGPVKQERWIAENLAGLNAKVAIGLGGTFDYVAGKKFYAPRWIRQMGLEWMFRLITQPSRIRRIWHGTYGLVAGAVREKVFSSMPLRQNVLGVIINKENQILVARRKIKKISNESPDKADEHWQFPQGGVDKGENLLEAANREIWEETGITGLQYLGQSERTNKYLWSQPSRNVLFNRLKYSGQEQHILFFRYAGDGMEIKPDNREFSSFKWVTPEDLTATVHPFRKKAADIIIEEIHKYL